MSTPLLCFDLDNTLWPVDTVIARAEAESWAWLSRTAPEVVARTGVDALRAQRNALLRANPAYFNNLTALRRDVIAAAIAAAGYEDAVARELAQRTLEVFLDHRNRVEFFPGATAALERLAGRYRLAALSNGNADLARIGLAHLFDIVLSAEKVGHAKPHPAMFERALAESRTRAARALHIGDHPEQDVLAARAAGLAAIWANPLRLPRPVLLPADVAKFEDFAALDALLDAWREGLPGNPAPDMEFPGSGNTRGDA